MVTYQSYADSKPSDSSWNPNAWLRYETMRDSDAITSRMGGASRVLAKHETVGAGYVAFDRIPQAGFGHRLKIKVTRDAKFGINAILGQRSHKQNYNKGIRDRTNDKAAIVFLSGLGAHPSQFDKHRDAFKAQYGDSVALYQPFVPLKGNGTLEEVLTAKPTDPVEAKKANHKRLMLKIAIVALVILGLGAIVSGIGALAGVPLILAACGMAGYTGTALFVSAGAKILFGALGLALAKSLSNARKKIKEPVPPDVAQIFEEVKAWALKNPFKPIILVGVSNGSRLAANLAIMLKEAGIENPIKCSCVAGVMFGTTMMNQPSWSERAQKIWRKTAVGSTHPAVFDALSWANEEAKQLIGKMRAAADEGMDFEFHVSASDPLVFPAAAAFPSGIRNAKYYYCMDEGHSSVIAAALPTQFRNVTDYIERHQFA